MRNLQLHVPNKETVSKIETGYLFGTGTGNKWHHWLALKMFNWLKSRNFLRLNFREETRIVSDIVELDMAKLDEAIMTSHHAIIQIYDRVVDQAIVGPDVFQQMQRTNRHDVPFISFNMNGPSGAFVGKEVVMYNDFKVTVVPWFVGGVLLIPSDNRITDYNTETHRPWG